jgi:hypothetical protein
VSVASSRRTNFGWSGPCGSSNNDGLGSASNANVHAGRDLKSSKQPNEQEQIDQDDPAHSRFWLKSLWPERSAGGDEGCTGIGLRPGIPSRLSV